MTKPSFPPSGTSAVIWKPRRSVQNFAQGSISATKRTGVRRLTFMGFIFSWCPSAEEPGWDLIELLASERSFRAEPGTRARERARTAFRIRFISRAPLLILLDI